MSIKRNNKKSQLTIFVATFVIIVVLVIILISTSNQSKLNEEKNTKNEISHSTEKLKIYDIQKTINHCLDRSVDRATIISGLQGGYFLKHNNTAFYDNYSENHTFVFIPQDLHNLYSNNLLSALNINRNPIQTLLYLRDISRNPNFQNNINYNYNNISIKEDYQNFIQKDLVACLNFTYYEENQHKIELFNETPVLNVTFNIDSINVDLKYRINSLLTDDKVSLDKISITKEVKYLRLFKFIGKLLSDKMINRSIDILDISRIETNALYANLPPGDININLLKIIDDPDYKLYNYRISDSSSKIKGEKFIYSFGYRNLAPILNDITDITGANKIEQINNTFYFYMKLETEIHGNLYTDLYEYDEHDVWNLNNIFEEQHIETNDIIFHLYSNGDMSFESSIGNSFQIPIKILDGEVENNYVFIFLPVAPDNTNNQNTKDSIRIDNTNKDISDRGYDIMPEFKDKSLEYIVNGEHEVFAYGVTGEKIVITFVPGPTSSFDVTADGCSYSSDTGNCEINNLQSETEVTLKIISNIETISYKVTIYPADCLGPNGINPNDEIEVTDSNGDKHLLGLTNKEVYGGAGDLTCCDLSYIKKVAEDPLLNKPKSLTGTNNNIFGVSGNPHIASNFDVFMCIDMDHLNNEVPGRLKDFAIYDEFLNNKIGPVFSSTFRANCKGISPLFFENIDPFGGSMLFDVTSMRDIGTGGGTIEFEEPKTIQFSIVAGTTSNCGFCINAGSTGLGLQGTVTSHIDDEEYQIFLDTAFTDINFYNKANIVNSDYYDAPYLFATLDNTYPDISAVLYGYNWGGSTDNINWQTSVVGLGFINGETIYAGREYCKTNDKSYEWISKCHKTDYIAAGNPPRNIDYYFNNPINDKIKICTQTISIN